MRRIKDSNGELHKSYSEYLKSKHWNSMKHKCRLEYGYICSHCNISGIILHLHHKTYKRVGNENISDLMFLCPDCHAAEHERLLILKQNKPKKKRRKKRKKKKKPVPKKNNNYKKKTKRPDKLPPQKKLEDLSKYKPVDKRFHNQNE